MAAVQITEPEPEPTAPDDPQVKKQFSAGVAKRLSGRPPLSSTPSRSSTLSQISIEGAADMKATTSPAFADDQNQHPHPHRHKLDGATERLLGQVVDWLEREKVKKEHKKSRKHSHTLRRKSPANSVSVPAPESPRPRGDSIGSDSSEVSLDRLQRILDDSMAVLGLNPTSALGARLGRRHRKRSSRNLLRTASSDTEWVDDDVLVPSCDAVLDNSKTQAYTGGQAGADDSASLSSRKEERDKQNWISFKNEIIRLAHTLRLKGWRRVPLDSGESISVERLSGALTNAVYVVSPPSESLLPREPGKKQPTKVLLRVYGPQVEHLIDRENELGVLKRLARKKIGPRLLGTFSNGRFEQYLNATALTAPVLREPDTSRQIAKRMRELHDGVELLKEEKDEGPGVWKNWDKWLSQVEKTVLFLDRQMLSQSQNLPGGVWKSRGFVCGVQWPVFKALVDKYRKHLEAYYGSPKKIRDKLVFAHNDVSPPPLFAYPQDNSVIN
jgi:choline kinase